MEAEPFGVGGGLRRNIVSGESVERGVPPDCPTQDASEDVVDWRYVRNDLHALRMVNVRTGRIRMLLPSSLSVKRREVQRQDGRGTRNVIPRAAPVCSRERIHPS
jgi:hypothetical protein